MVAATGLFVLAGLFGGGSGSGLGLVGALFALLLFLGRLLFSGFLFARLLCRLLGRGSFAFAAASAATAASARAGGALGLLGLLRGGIGAVFQRQRGHFVGKGGRGEVLLAGLLVALGALVGNDDALARALAVSQHAHFAVAVGFLRGGGFVQTDAQRFTHEIDRADVAGTVGREHERVVLGHTARGVLVGLLLVLEAAHKTAAGAGNFGGVEAQILRLRHLDGHGHEIVEEARAAEGTAADAETAEHLCLVAHADLTQLDARTENAREVAHQLAEVHAALGGEEKDDLAAVEVALHAHELHVEPVVGDLLLAGLERIPLAAAVIFHRASVVLRRHADERSQRLDDGFVRDLVVARQAQGVLRALRGLHDHVLTALHGDAVGVKIIFFAAASKADANYFSQRISSNSAARPPKSGPTPTL